MGKSRAERKCRDAGLSFGIVGHSGHEYADAPHAIGLLRTRRAGCRIVCYAQAASG
jgi:hypothetical protein